MPEETRKALEVTGEAVETHKDLEKALKATSVHIRGAMKHDIKSKTKEDDMERNRHNAILDKIRENYRKVEHVMGKNFVNIHKLAMKQAAEMMKGQEQKKQKQEIKWDMPAA